MLDVRPIYTYGGKLSLLTDPIQISSIQQRAERVRGQEKGREMEKLSMAKIMMTLLFVGALATAVRGGSQYDDVPFFKCGEETYVGALTRQFIKNLDEVLFELRTETPVDGNFDGKAERRHGVGVFGRASCFSSLTTNVEGCTKCLDKAVMAVKKNCTYSLEATAGTAAAGCSLSYSNVESSRV